MTTAAMRASITTLSSKDSLFGRFSYEKFIQTSPNPLTGGQGTCCLPTPSFAASKFDLGPYVAGIQNTSLIAQGLSVDETHLFSPTFLNEFRMGYARTNPFTTQSDFGHNSSTSLGIAGLNISQFTTGLPNFTIGSACGNEFTCLQGGTAFLPAHPRANQHSVRGHGISNCRAPSTEDRLPLHQSLCFAVHEHDHARRAHFQRQLHQLAGPQPSEAPVWLPFCWVSPTPEAAIS